MMGICVCDECVNNEIHTGKPCKVICNHRNDFHGFKKIDAEVVEEVEKSCKTCNYSYVESVTSKCKMASIFYCPNNEFADWQPIKSNSHEIKPKKDCTKCVNYGDAPACYLANGCIQWSNFKLVEVKQATGTTEDAKPFKQAGEFEKIGKCLGEMVDDKQEAYGDAITATELIMKVLYPNGIKPEQYRDALLQVRITDKQCRIARGNESKFSESPYKDIAGYGLLGVGHGQI